MGFVKALLEGNFRTDEEGRTVFYPNSFWGAGYVVSAERKREIIRFLAKFFGSVLILFLLCLLMPFLLFVSSNDYVFLIIFVAIFIGIGIVFTGHHAFMKEKVKCLKKAEERFGFMEYLRINAILTGPFGNGLILAFGLLELSIVLYRIYYTEWRGLDKLLLLVPIGLCCLFFMHNTWYSIKHKRLDSDS